MKTRTTWLVVASGLGVCVLFGSAAAQTAKVEVQAPSAVAPADRAAAADQYITKMQASSARVRHLLDDARRQKDVVKTTCLGDKLNQIEIGLKSARERAANFKAAVARGDADLGTHEFQVLTVLRQRVEQLDAEANQCIGEELGLPGDTRSTVSIDPNIATVETNPPTEPFAPPIVVLMPPNAASPVK